MILDGHFWERQDKTKLGYNISGFLDESGAVAKMFSHFKLDLV